MRQHSIEINTETLVLTHNLSTKFFLINFYLILSTTTINFEPGQILFNNKAIIIFYKLYLSRIKYSLKGFLTYIYYV